MAADATMVSGDTKSLAVTITDSAGVAVNLAGATFLYVVTDMAGVVAITKTEADMSLSGAGNNVVTIPLEPEDTADLDGLYRHELQVTDSSGNVSTALQGNLVITGDAA